MTAFTSPPAIQLRLAGHYADKLRRASAAFRRGPGNRAHWLHVIQQDWDLSRHPGHDVCQRAVAFRPEGFEEGDVGFVSANQILRGSNEVLRPGEEAAVDVGAVFKHAFGGVQPDAKQGVVALDRAFKFSEEVHLTPRPFSLILS